MTEPPCVRLSGLSKSYGGVQALRNVTLQIAASEVHAICGENGAGKSTLIKLLTGIVTPDSGDIHVNGHQLPTGSVAASEAAGIAVMHQESTAFPDLNAVDNLFVGRERTRFGGLLLDHRAMRRRTRELLERLGSDLPIDVPISQLSPVQRQTVALARTLSRECRLLIMDEPTAALAARETQRLLQMIRQLREDGVSVLYVSHRLEEIFEIADRITVLRDGEVVATKPTGEVDPSELIRLMVGRELLPASHSASLSSQPGDVILSVENLTRENAFHNVSFQVRAGEIVGLTGLVGAGRSEIVRSVFGVDSYDTGRVLVAGESVASDSVTAAMTAGLALVPEDRQHEGLVLPMTVAQNLSMVMLPQLTKGPSFAGYVDLLRESKLVATQVRELQVRTDGTDVAAATLSGGNQQKLVLGKWLATKPKVLILDEPTRGVDVGAKAQVHELIRREAADGLATLVVSSDLPELLTLCHRLLVVREGHVVAERMAASATQEELLALSLPEPARINSEQCHIDAQSDRPADLLRTASVGTPRLRRLLRQREFGISALILVIAVLVGFVDFGFLSGAVWTDILIRCAPTAIVACGVMLVVAVGEIDISVGSLMALLAAVMGRMIATDEANLPLVIGIPLTLMLGTLIGLCTGVIVSYGRVPSIIVTLGLLTALRGVATLIMDGTNIDHLPTGLTDAAKHGVSGIPVSVITAFTVILTTWILIGHTPLGRRLYGLGSSPNSARTAGLSERNLKLFVFAWTGFLTALATVVDVPRLPKIESGIGSEFELLVVTCVVVGGVSITGGRGRLAGVLLAVVLMTMVRPVLTFLDVGESGEKWTKAIQGSFILLAVITDSVVFRRRSRSTSA